MTNQFSIIDIAGLQKNPPLGWKSDLQPNGLTRENLVASLKSLNEPVYILNQGQDTFISNSGFLSTQDYSYKTLAFCYPFTAEMLGDPSFKQTYGLQYALYGGSMANGIASESMIISLGNSGFMGSFGAGGLLPARIEKAISQIQDDLKGKPYCFNLINSPFEPDRKSVV